MYRLGVVLALSAAVPATLAAQQPMNSDPRFAHADTIFLRSDWKAAADAYRVALRADSANGMGWFTLHKIRDSSVSTA